MGPDDSTPAPTPAPLCGRCLDHGALIDGPSTERYPYACVCPAGTASTLGAVADQAPRPGERPFYESLQQAVERAIADGRAEELLREAMAAMDRVSATRFAADAPGAGPRLRTRGPHSYYGGVVQAVTAFADAIDPRMIERRQHGDRPRAQVDETPLTSR